jgi:hypothetical protein
MNHTFFRLWGGRILPLTFGVALSAACSSNEPGEAPPEVARAGGSGSPGEENPPAEGTAGAGAADSEPDPAAAGSGGSDTPSGNGGSGSAGKKGTSESPRGTGGTRSPASGGSAARPPVGSAGTSGGEGSDAGASSELPGHAGEPGIGSGGNASSGSGGTEANGATGGTDATGGTAAGGSDASGGSSNEPPPPDGEACRRCGQQSAACGASLTRCEQSPVCSAWLDCVSACSGADCARGCDEVHRNAVLLTTPVYECLCGQCGSECSSLEVCDRSCAEAESAPAPSATVPATLAETGLYAQSGGVWELAPYVRSFQPEFALFSDYAEKERFIYIPRCEPIDTRDMDHWNFPVGTRVWKQFTQDGTRIETRVLVRYGAGAADWAMASYQWPSSGSTDPTLATLAHRDGVRNVNGTGADIPAVSDCKFCHEKMTDRVLGFSAIQLSHDLGGGVDFVDLVDWGMLSNAPVRTGYDPPGDATAQAALGYLHANCGGCHNDTGIRVSLYLRLLVAHTSVETSWAYTTGVNALTTNPAFPMDRIEPGDPAQSSILVRMTRDPAAGETGMMPPVSREVVHDEAVASVSAWIQSLPR